MSTDCSYISTHCSHSSARNFYSLTHCRHNAVCDVAVLNGFCSVALIVRKTANNEETVENYEDREVYAELRQSSEMIHYSTCLLHCVFT